MELQLWREGGREGGREGRKRSSELIYSALHIETETWDF